MFGFSSGASFLHGNDATMSLTNSVNLPVASMLGPCSSVVFTRAFMTFIISEKRKVVTKMHPVQTMIKALMRLGGSNEITSRMSKNNAPILLNQSTKRAIIFFAAACTSPIFLACWARIVMYVISDPNAVVIINVTIVVAQLVSLLVSGILTFLYVRG
jgi:Mg2+/citrate symporter